MIIDTLTNHKDNCVVLPITKELLLHILTSHHQNDGYSIVFACNDVPDYMEEEVSQYRDNKLDYSEVDEVMTCPLVAADGEAKDGRNLKEVTETQVAKGYYKKGVGYYKKGNYLKPLYDQFAKFHPRPISRSDRVNDYIVDFVRDDEDKVIHNPHPLIANAVGLHPIYNECFIEVPKFQKGAPTVVMSKRKKDGRYSRQANTSSHTATTNAKFLDGIMTLGGNRKSLKLASAEVVKGMQGVGFQRVTEKTEARKPYIGLVKKVTVPAYTLPGMLVNACFSCGGEDIDIENNHRCNSCGHERRPR